MRLSELRAALGRHFAVLRFAPDGEHLECEAPEPLTLEIVKGLQDYRPHVLRQVKEGRLADGRLDFATLRDQPGRCASCSWWQGPDAYGDGLCVLGRQAHGWPYGNPDAPVMTTALHCCAAQGGQGWQAKRSVPASR